MKLSEKVLFVSGVIFTVIALLLACFASYFGIAALLAVHINGVEGFESIGVAFMVVFLVIFSAASWGASLLAAVLLLVAPVRVAEPRVRFWSRLCVIVLAAVALLLIVLLVFCLI